jgi:hypothetical protein
MARCSPAWCRRFAKIVEAGENPVFGDVVPASRQSREFRPDRFRLGGAVAPRRDHGNEYVVAALGHVAPHRRAFLVHRHRVAIHPEQVQSQIPQQVVAGPVSARIDSSQQLITGGRALFEVPPDARLELLHGIELGKIDIGDEVGGQDHAPMAVDDEWSEAVAHSVSWCVVLARALSSCAGRR